MNAVRTLTLSTLVASAAIALACGGSSTSQPTAPTPAQPAPGNAGGTQTTITITAAGVNPNSVTVARGATVLFVNNDSVAHVPASNPHPVHTDCPEINVGTLTPGQSQATKTLTTARSCGFHDHNNPQNAALQGTIVIQ